DPAPQPISRTGGGAAGLACLQEAIYFEAGGTGEAGRRAVGYVILNRAADPRFPSSICGVVHEGEGNGSGCQFSYRCDGRAERIRDPYEYRKSGETARLVLSAKERDITGGALFFHAASMPPGWFATRQRTGRFGGNIFYR
ncbi:MAG: cell wall hydrolase, partial [Paracoccaceae bacterium]